MVKNIGILLIFIIIISCSKQYSGEGSVTHIDKMLTLQISNKDLKKHFSLEKIQEIEFYKNYKLIAGYTGDVPYPSFDKRFYSYTKNNYFYFLFYDANQLPDVIIIKYDNHSINIYLALYDENLLEIINISHASYM